MLTKHTMKFIHQNKTWGILISILLSTSLFQTKAQNIIVDVCPGEVPSPFIADSGITGGVGPFTYQWQTSNDSLNWLPASGKNDSTSYVPTSAYTDTTFIRRIVIDQSCGDTAFSNVITIRAPQPIAFNEVATNVSCFGEDDGSISINPTGGTMPYIFTWNTGDTINSLSSLGPNSYSVTITDANN